MALPPRVNKLIAGSVLVIGLVIVLAATGPRPQTEVSGSVPRLGGVCLQLERWDWFGWRIVGQTHTVSDTYNAVWHPASPDPPCAPVLKQIYRIRTPSDAPFDVYRLCGLADDQPCIEFRRVPFAGSPGP